MSLIYFIVSNNKFVGFSNFVFHRQKTEICLKVYSKLVFGTPSLFEPSNISYNIAVEEESPLKNLFFTEQNILRFSA
jgi:hypothetical protein